MGNPQTQERKIEKDKNGKCEGKGTKPSVGNREELKKTLIENENEKKSLTLSSYTSTYLLQPLFIIFSPQQNDLVCEQVLYTLKRGLIDIESFRVALVLLNL